MQTVTVKVPEISSDQRQLFEKVLGTSLSDDQRIVITVLPTAPASGHLPDYLNVYEGLSEADIAHLESVILQRDRTPRHE